MIKIIVENNGVSKERENSYKEIIENYLKIIQPQIDYLIIKIDVSERKFCSDIFTNRFLGFVAAAQLFPEPYIALFEPLMKTYSLDEVKATICHELCHLLHEHPTGLLFTKWNKKISSEKGNFIDDFVKSAIENFYSDYFVCSLMIKKGLINEFITDTKSVRMPDLVEIKEKIKDRPFSQMQTLLTLIPNYSRIIAAKQNNIDLGFFESNFSEIKKIHPEDVQKELDNLFTSLHRITEGVKFETIAKIILSSFKKIVNILLKEDLFDFKIGINE